MNTITTAYRMVKALNVKLAEEGLPEVPTQYGYNELRKGRVTGIEGKGQQVSVEDAKAWISKQLEARRNGTNVHGATVNELLQDLEA